VTKIGTAIFLFLVLLGSILLTAYPANAGVFVNACNVGDSMVLGVKGSDPLCQELIDNRKADEAKETTLMWFKVLSGTALLFSLIIFIRKEFAEPRFSKEISSRFKKLKKTQISFVAMTVGSILTVFPILTPDSAILAAVVSRNGSYFTAVTLSEFMGVRFGVIIMLGLVMFFGGILAFRYATK
jgi:hypothetical protein